MKTFMLVAAGVITAGLSLGVVPQAGQAPAGSYTAAQAAASAAS